MMTNRYRWVKPSHLPDRIALLDNVTSQYLAVITNVGRCWFWRRNTTPLLHGAISAEGNERTLMQAKSKILAGLPAD